MCERLNRRLTDPFPIKQSRDQRSEYTAWCNTKPTLGAHPDVRPRRISRDLADALVIAHYRTQLLLNIAFIPIRLLVNDFNKFLGFGAYPHGLGRGPAGAIIDILLII